MSWRCEWENEDDAFPADVEPASFYDDPAEGFDGSAHGSPELDADAEKLRALGADPGLTLNDLAETDLI